MTQQQRGDVVDLLLDQLRAIRELCDEISSAAGADREEPFRSLLRLLAVHEAVEEELVHPYVKRRVEGATAAVADRVEEEREVNKMLVASALAPTHPHPGNESASRALLVGTPMAMMDRARDLLRNASPGRTRGAAPDAPSA